MRNRKKRGLIIFFTGILVFFTSLVFFVIGNHEGMLVPDILRRIALMFLILASIALIYSIIIIKKSWYRRTWKKNKITIISILITFYALGCCAFLFLLYGPNHRFRDWLITTAMVTKDHQYYCKWFYGDEIIALVMDENYVDDGGAESDSSLINHRPTITYANEYEKEILEREEGQLYKLVRFKVNGCNAYLGVVYDPSKVSVGHSKYIGRTGQFIYDMAKEQDATIAINGGAFSDPGGHGTGGVPTGVTISDSKIISDNPVYSNRKIIGIDKDNNLVLRQNGRAQDLIDEGIRDAVTMGPFLIVNGKPSYIRGNGGWGYAARAAIGQRADGIMLLLVVDSTEFRTKGASMVDLTEIMQRYGAINAANLDGGTSTGMVVEGELINKPVNMSLENRTRPIATMIMVKE